MKKYLALFLIFLTGIVFADMACTSDSTPNIGSNLNVNCTTETSVSSCKAIISVTNQSIIVGEYPQYPNYFFQEDRQPYYTFPDGSFMFSVFMDDKTFYRDNNYTVDVICFNPVDNLTNSTAITFSPIIPSPPEFLSGYVLWARTNAGILLFYFILGLISLLAIIFIYKILNSALKRRTF